MSEPIAYLNGQYVPAVEARLPVSDLGLQGVSVTETVRTFRHRCFRVGQHVSRLFRSLRYVGFDTVLTEEQVVEIFEEVVRRNAPLLTEGDDLGVTAFVTGGLNRSQHRSPGAESSRQPTFCVHSYPLAWDLWAEKYDSGQHLVIPSIRHLPVDCLDPKVKHRSRLHWYLADLEASRVDPRASALLLDHSGNVTETATGNVFVVERGAIFTPPSSRVLEGVSRDVVAELARTLGIPCEERDCQPYHLLSADEVWTASTPYCLLPVTRINQQPIGTGEAGPLYKCMMAAWNELVGLDIVEQARQK